VKWTDDAPFYASAVPAACGSAFQRRCAITPQATRAPELPAGWDL
jgi:hypothetical protein